MLVGLGLRAFAALIAAFGLLMLELSAYFALVQIWSAISAAAILGGVNFADCRNPVRHLAARPPSGRELELANEIHGSSVDALQLEARALQSQLSRDDPPSAQRRLAVADRAADHDHHQKPEEAGGSSRGSRGRAEIIAGPRLAPDRQQGATHLCQKSSEADPEYIPASAVPADPYRACPRAWSSRRRRQLSPMSSSRRSTPTTRSIRLSGETHREACRITRLRPDEEDRPWSSRSSSGRRLGAPLRIRSKPDSLRISLRG